MTPTKGSRRTRPCTERTLASPWAPFQHMRHFQNAERGSPKFEKAAMRWWLERYLVENAPRLGRVAEITASLARLEPRRVRLTASSCPTLVFPGNCLTLSRQARSR